MYSVKKAAPYANDISMNHDPQMFFQYMIYKFEIFCKSL